MIQLDELWDSYSRWLDSLWVEMYAKGYDPHKNKEDPAFDSDFAKVWNIRALQDKVSAKISRLEVKSGVSREEAQVKMMLANQGRLSTSF